MSIDKQHLINLGSDPEFARLAADILRAQTIAETTKERVDKYIRVVFDAFEFYVGPDMKEAGSPPERITNPDKLCRSQDEALLKEYYALCDKAHRMAGYDLPAGWCPALVADSKHRVAQQSLLLYADSKLGTPFAQIFDPDNTEKAVDLMLGIALQNPLTEQLGRAGLPTDHASMNTWLNAA